ncbi:hypothetical protein AYB33_08365 [Leptospira santarosai]|nr:hypothetical protein AYB33_08365 [Leptospira santarosai]
MTALFYRVVRTDRSNSQIHKITRGKNEKFLPFFNASEPRRTRARILNGLLAGNNPQNYAETNVTIRF